MNQGKPEEIKYEMEPIHVDLMDVSELKGTDFGQFESDSHIVYSSVN